MTLDGAVAQLYMQAYGCDQPCCLLHVISWVHVEIWLHLADLLC